MLRNSASCSALYFGKIHEWKKLSNSGDALKLMVPNYGRKTISGQNNYLGMVTSRKMNENEMGYRGSKSKIGVCLNPQPNKTDIFVKEIGRAHV